MSGRPAWLAILVFFLSLTTVVAPVLGTQTYRYEYNPLITDSALIVVANIVKVTGNYSSSELGLSGRVYQISVSDWVKGGGYVYPLQIVDGNSTIEGSTGDPSIQVGSRYVLFLFNTGVSENGVNPGGVCLTYPTVVRCHNFPPPTNSTWGITGGPQGKFLVRDGLVYGFKNLYPQLYGRIIVDANAVPLDSFVSMIRLRASLVSAIIYPWITLPIFLILLLPSLSRRVRESHAYKSLKRIGLFAFYAVTATFVAYLLEISSFSFLATLDFWTGFIIFGTALLAVVAISLKERDERQLGIKKFRFGGILLAVSGVTGVVVVLIVLFQAGDTMFEKDYYRLALINGIFIGSLVGAVLGDVLHRIKRVNRGSVEAILSKSPMQIPNP